MGKGSDPIREGDAMGKGSDPSRKGDAMGKGCRSNLRPTARGRCIVLLSGGLDSTLALRLMLDQGIECRAVSFVSPFCTCTPKQAGCCHMATAVAKEAGVPIEVVSKGLEYLDVVRNPRFGYGRHLNPCIDCRIFMLRKTRALMDAFGATFVVTGEVLGQRPKSQRLDALSLIERESGLKGRILRPLSAQFLEPTLPEREATVDRAKLLSIRGRSRKEQFRLVNTLQIEAYACPGGGCLLTDDTIAGRLKDLFARGEPYTMRDIQLLMVGRHFRLHEALKAIVGRNEAENHRLEALRGPDAHVFDLPDAPSPLMVAIGTLRDGDVVTLGRLLRHFSPKARGPGATVRHTFPRGSEDVTVDSPASPEEVEGWRMKGFKESR